MSNEFCFHLNIFQELNGSMSATPWPAHFRNWLMPIVSARYPNASAHSSSELSWRHVLRARDTVAPWTYGIESIWAPIVSASLVHVSAPYPNVSAQLPPLLINQWPETRCPENACGGFALARIVSVLLVHYVPTLVHSFCSALLSHPWSARGGFTFTSIVSAWLVHHIPTSLIIPALLHTSFLADCRIRSHPTCSVSSVHPTVKMMDHRRESVFFSLL